MSWIGDFIKNGFQREKSLRARTQLIVGTSCHCWSLDKYGEPSMPDKHAKWCRPNG